MTYIRYDNHSSARTKKTTEQKSNRGNTQYSKSTTSSKNSLKTSPRSKKKYQRSPKPSSEHSKKSYSTTTSKTSTAQNTPVRPFISRRHQILWPADRFSESLAQNPQLQRIKNKKTQSGLPLPPHLKDNLLQSSHRPHPQLIITLQSRASPSQINSQRTVIQNPHPQKPGPVDVQQPANAQGKTQNQVAQEIQVQRRGKLHPGESQQIPLVSLHPQLLQQTLPATRSLELPRTPPLLHRQRQQRQPHPLTPAQEVLV
jgi:hypothetical protein